MKFDYQQIITTCNQLDIDDIGNCCVIAINSRQEEYYLVIRTILGVTEIINYGPIIPDLDVLPHDVSYTYSRMGYNEKKIITQIKKFINPTKTVVVEAKECDITYVRNSIKNFIEKIGD